MLAVPIVTSATRRGELSAPLQRFLSSQGSSSSSEQIATDLTFFENIRGAAVNVNDVDESGKQALLTYCHHLRALSTRLLDFENEMGISVSWCDAFDSKHTIAKSSLSFDWACSLWNLAALESLKGARVDRSTEDGIRTANRHFQVSAGYFEYILNQVLPKLASPLLPCFSEDCLNMARQLMLAQAQLCFYEKAVQDKKNGNMKSSIIAKLSAHTSTLYTSAQQYCARLKLDQSWYAIIDFQSKCFHGAAEYWQAVASKEDALNRGSGYGEEVVRLGRAERHVKLAIDVSKRYQLVSSLPSGAEALLQAAVSARTAAEHDLRTVYMESLPQDSALSEVPGVAMVKASAVDVFLPPDVASEQHVLFRHLLPRGVRPAIDQHVDEITMMFAISNSMSEDATASVRSKLNAIGLPEAIEAAKSADVVPDQLWGKFQRVQTIGGYPRLQSIWRDIQSSSARALQSISSIDSALDREEKADDEFRTRYPNVQSLSAMTPSFTLNTDTRNNCKSLKDTYAAAQQSDLAVSAEMQSMETQFQQLSLTKEGIVALFPAPTHNLIDFEDSDATAAAADTGTGEAQIIASLEEKLHSMAQLIESRAKIVCSLMILSKTDVTGDAIAVMNTGGNIFDSLAERLTEAQKLSASVTESTEQERVLLDEIINLNEEFVKARATSVAQIEKKKVIEDLDQTVVKFFELQSKLSTGSTFYGNLQKRINSLLQEADDLAYTQQWQRQEFEASQAAEMQRQQDHGMAARLAHQQEQLPPMGSVVGVSSGNTTGTGNHQPQPQPYGQPNWQQPLAQSGAAYPTFDHASPAAAAVPASRAPASSVAYPSITAPGLAPTLYSPQQQQQQRQPTTVGGVQPPTQPSVGGLQYQYNSTSYSTLPAPPAPQINAAGTGQVISAVTPAGHAQQPLNESAAAASPPVNEQAVARLSEMGFPRDQVVQALTVNGGNEESALNSLLAGPSPDAAASPTQAGGVGAGAAPPQKPAKSGSFFGKIWGKN